MNRLILASSLAALGCVSQTAAAQVAPAVQAVFADCLNCRTPIYKDGGFEGLLLAIAKSVRFPPCLPKSGRVFVTFTINESGRVQNAFVQQGFFPLADAEALRAIQNLGEFIPGTNDKGQSVAVTLTVPVTFALE